MVPNKRKLWFSDEKLKNFVKAFFQVNLTEITKWQLHQTFRAYFEVYRGNRMAVEPVQFTFKDGDIYIVRNDPENEFVEVEPLRCFDFVLLISKKDWIEKIKSHSTHLPWIKHVNPGEAPNKIDGRYSKKLRRFLKPNEREEDAVFDSERGYWKILPK